MRYIDFDGVILDTEDILFYEWRKNKERNKLMEADKITYIKNSNWKEIIASSPVINDSIYILKHTNPIESTILTKVHSLNNEGIEKVKFLRSVGVKQSIILVPYNLKKIEMVDANGNSLIDDCLKTLDEWLEEGGYPMFFDKKGNNIDSWNVTNKKNYQRVRRIDDRIIR